MSQISLRGVASFATTVVLVLCAVTTTALFVRREFQPGKEPKLVRVEPQPDWESYVKGGHRMGKENARLVFVEFADFQCPACKIMADQLRDAQRRYPDAIAVVYRHFPLPSIHPQALRAGIASECAARQDRFQQMYEALYEQADSIGITSWRAFAARAGVTNLGTFDRCMSDSTAAAIVQNDRATAVRMGARGTPMVLVDGRRYNGALSDQELDSLITARLGRTGVGDTPSR